MSLLELFCAVDEFYVRIEEQESPKRIGKGKRGPRAGLCGSEVMTILIHFHQSHYRDFKAYYGEYVLKTLHGEFPGLVSYSRFVELIPQVLPHLLLFLLSRMGKTRGIAFLDSTAIAVCHNKRIFHHKVFEGFAARGKSTMGYFWGFKLHLVVNDQGELLAFQLSPGNIDDRVPVPELVKRLWGKIFADKGYVSQKLFALLFEQGIQLITPPKKSKKKQETRLLPLMDKLLARKRSIIETINDQLKNISQIVHTRHRSATNFLVNLLGALLAYTFQEKKPAIRFDTDELATLPPII